ncbi:hypothetical protein Y032_0201g1741 [Ancylostoma ceylanicum]|uniref:Uncharacterized protein n=1 Tax=Ancylostoma ceylanicum TaxID=53326 RepID=A0A016SMB7_9BILA|nr:hypothetical protein Y032_0201g1741 [Ancylostoma ceylanicum]
MNPSDYSVQGVLQARACAAPHKDVATLKAALTREWNNLNTDYLWRTVDAFPQRLHECIKAKGNRVENDS